MTKTKVNLDDTVCMAIRYCDATAYMGIAGDVMMIKLKRLPLETDLNHAVALLCDKNNIEHSISYSDAGFEREGDDYYYYQPDIESLPRIFIYREFAFAIDHIKLDPGVCQKASRRTLADAKQILREILWPGSNNQEETY